MKNYLKNHGEHILLIISTLSLALLVVWWSVFLNRSINNQHSLLSKKLKGDLKFFAFKMDLNKNNLMQTGIVKEDNRFEIVESGEPGSCYSIVLNNSDRPLCLRIRKHILDEMDADFRSKKIMVIGESGLLVFIVFVSIFFLYKFIRLEKRSTREMEEFWGKITHEIKTPIMGIKSFLESLKNNAIKKEQLPVFLEMAIKEVKKQEKLAENILTGSSFMNKRIKLNLTVFNLVEFLDVYFNEHFMSALENNLNLEYDNKKVISVKGDKNVLRVIIDNIIDNACKYCSPGLELIVNIREKNRTAEIILQDNGPGFDPDIAENLFNAFKFSDPELPETSHGTGMGLFISRNLAREMGADIDAKSDGKGKGAEFKIVLPIVKL
ncbi:MAG: HAMP domain-containing sensor histidine kinase [Acidobacteriota bacterium]